MSLSFSPILDEENFPFPSSMNHPSSSPSNDNQIHHHRHGISPSPSPPPMMNNHSCENSYSSLSTPSIDSFAAYPYPHLHHTNNNNSNFLLDHDNHNDIMVKDEYFDNESSGSSPSYSTDHSSLHSHSKPYDGISGLEVGVGMGVGSDMDMDTNLGMNMTMDETLKFLTHHDDMVMSDSLQMDHQHSIAMEMSTFPSIEYSHNSNSNSPIISSSPAPLPASFSSSPAVSLIPLYQPPAPFRVSPEKTKEKARKRKAKLAMKRETEKEREKEKGKEKDNPLDISMSFSPTDTEKRDGESSSPSLGPVGLESSEDVNSLSENDNNNVISIKGGKVNSSSSTSSTSSNKSTSSTSPPSTSSSTPSYSSPSPLHLPLSSSSSSSSPHTKKIKHESIDHDDSDNDRDDDNDSDNENLPISTDPNDPLFNLSPDCPEYKRLQRLQRNRASAQLSRERKKNHVKVLEDAMEKLRKENKVIAERLKEVEGENKKMKQAIQMYIIREREKIVANHQRQQMVNVNMGINTNSSPLHQPKAIPSVKREYYDEKHDVAEDSPSHRMKVREEYHDDHDDDNSSNPSSPPSLQSPTSSSDLSDSSLDTPMADVTSPSSPSLSSPSMIPPVTSLSSSLFTGGKKRKISNTSMVTSPSHSSGRASLMMFGLVFSFALIYHLVGIDFSPIPHSLSSRSHTDSLLSSPSSSSSPITLAPRHSLPSSSSSVNGDIFKHLSPRAHHKSRVLNSIESVEDSQSNIQSADNINNNNKNILSENENLPVRSLDIARLSKPLDPSSSAKELLDEFSYVSSLALVKRDDDTAHHVDVNVNDYGLVPSSASSCNIPDYLLREYQKYQSHLSLFDANSQYALPSANNQNITAIYNDHHGDNNNHQYSAYVFCPSIFPIKPHVLWDGDDNTHNHSSTIKTSHRNIEREEDGRGGDGAVSKRLRKALGLLPSPSSSSSSSSSPTDNNSNNNNNGPQRKSMYDDDGKFQLGKNDNILFWMPMDNFNEDYNGWENEHNASSSSSSTSSPFPVKHSGLVEISCHISHIKPVFRQQS